MTFTELVLATIISTILWLLAVEYLMDVPIVGWLLSVAWLIPVAFFHSAWEEGRKPDRE